MNSPKISVITPSLNKARFLEEAINSVTAQRYEKVEHIIVDGGSTDGTISILNRYPHLKWISEPDKGQSDAMNKGFAMSTGEIIVYLNADDYFLPNAFKCVMPPLEQNEQFVVGRVKVVTGDGTCWIQDPRVHFEEMLKWWEKDSYCCNPVGYFYKREVQEAVGGFNLENHLSMDYEFLLNAAREFSFTKINDILGVFRMIPGTKTADSFGHRYYDLNFAFCEDFLESLEPDYVNAYKRERYRFIRKVREDEYFNSTLAYLRSGNYARGLGMALKFMLLNPIRSSRRLAGFLVKRVNIPFLRGIN